MYFISLSCLILYMLNVSLQSVYIYPDRLLLIFVLSVPSIGEELIGPAMEGVDELVLIRKATRLVMYLLQESVGLIRNIENGVF